jgi:integrase/recombinase XerC
MPYQRFLKFLQYEKRYSAHTLIAYTKDLEQFFEYVLKMYEVKDTKDVSHVFIRSWIVSLMEQKINPRSVRRKISTLKSFFKFLLREKQIDRNPMQKIISPKIAKQLPAFVDEQRMDLLLDTVEFDEGFKGARDKLIINIFYQTGMRLSELVNLKEGDINLYDLSIKVLGKRNKERIIPISHKLKADIENYFKIRNSTFSKDLIASNFLLLDNGNKIYDKYVYRLVKAKLGEVTTSPKKSPHILRHTFATQMLNHGAEINAVKEILGHASLAATQVYTHNTIEKLKNIYKQAHPKA